MYKEKVGGMRFADLLDKISSVDPEMRIRFTSPHPKDFPDEVIFLLTIFQVQANMLKIFKPFFKVCLKLLFDINIQRFFLIVEYSFFCLYLK